MFIANRTMPIKRINGREDSLVLSDEFTIVFEPKTLTILAILLEDEYGI